MIKIKDLEKGVTYLIQWIDEPEPFYAEFLCIDRGFVCFVVGGRNIVARPENLEILPNP